MKILFDGHQDYQPNAIQSVVDAFEGQPLAQGEYEMQWEEADFQPILAEMDSVFRELGWL